VDRPDEHGVMNERLLKLARFAALGRTVPVVAHEINNPLALITNNLYLLERDLSVLRSLLAVYQEAAPALAASHPEVAQRLQQAGGLDPAYSLSSPPKLLERARSGVRRIQELVRDVLSSGQSREALSPEVNVAAGIETALRLLQRRAEKLRVTVQSAPASLPLLTCSPSLVVQVVLHLAQNAIEACAGGGTVRVHAAAGAGGDVAITVSDTGPGIEPEQRERIFAPFFTTKASEEHDGLGLCIVQAMVAEQGGRIDIDRTPGGGASVTVQLPLQPPGHVDGRVQAPTGALAHHSAQPSRR
jgi:two-component system NtrC family sensor kinase